MSSYYAASSCAASVGLVPAAEATPAELYRAPPQGGLGPDWQAVTDDLQEEHQMNQMIVSLLVVLARPVLLSAALPPHCCYQEPEN